MKVVLLLSFTLTVLITVNVRAAAIETRSDVLGHHLTPTDQKYLAYVKQQIMRDKRSEDVFSLLKAKMAQSIKSKIGHIASASSHASHGKKDHKEHYYHHYEPPPEHHHHHEEEKTFDFWDLQKSILNTLLQAVKAIKGGLIAVKGHLIKGGGYLISAKGKMISAKGEAITNLGKHIASSALLIHKEKHHSSEESGPPEHEYIHHYPHHPPSGIGHSAPSGHGGHDGHEIELHSPHHHSAPSLSSYSDHDHKLPSSFEAYKDHLPHGAHQGILILKKIPKGHKEKHNGNDGSHHSSDSHKPDSIPEEPSEKPFKFLPDLKDILFASSMKGHKDKHSAHSSSAHSHHEYSDDEYSHHHYDSHSEHHDHHEHPDDHDHHDHHEDSHDHKSHHYPHSDDDDSSSHFESFSDNHESSLSNSHPHKYEHASIDHHVKPSGLSATNYGTPIGLTDNTDYLNKFHLLNSFQNTHSTGGLSDYKTKLETYEPLGLPSSVATPLAGAGLSSLVSHGYHHYPSYPVDLSQNFGAQHSLGYFGNYYATGPYY